MQRNEHPESEQADPPSERPASRYFSQPVAPEAAPPEPVIDTSPPQALHPEVEESADTLDVRASTEADSSEATTPRRSRARSGDGAKPGASPRKAAAPRVRGARAGGDAGDAANAESPAAGPEASAAEAEGATPAKAAAARPRSRARKPAAKPAE